MLHKRSYSEFEENRETRYRKTDNDKELLNKVFINNQKSVITETIITENNEKSSPYFSLLELLKKNSLSTNNELMLQYFVLQPTTNWPLILKQNNNNNNKIPHIKATSDHQKKLHYTYDIKNRKKIEKIIETLDSPDVANILFGNFPGKHFDYCKKNILIKVKGVNFNQNMFTKIRNQFSFIYHNDVAVQNNYANDKQFFLQSSFKENKNFFDIIHERRIAALKQIVIIDESGQNSNLVQLKDDPNKKNLVNNYFNFTYYEEGDFL